MCATTCGEGIMRPANQGMLEDLHLNPTVEETCDEAALCKQTNAATMLAVSDTTGRLYRSIPGGSLMS